ncbi:hypothetical protein BH20BAC1_BH20BAC1_11260 [soil metagenome]
MTRRYETLFRTTLWIGVVLLIITMFVSTFFRVNDLANFFRTGILPSKNSIEFGYANNPALTLVHILPGIIFLILGALQFIKPFRNRYLKWHRLLGKIYIILGLVVGITAIIMGLRIKFGGYTESAAVIVFGFYFLYGLINAYRHIKNRRYNKHREWMIRAFSIGIAVATMRPIIGMFFAFTEIPFNQFFGIVFWIAFILHALVAELWIRFTRKKIVVRI